MEHLADLGTMPDGGAVGTALGAASAAAAPLLVPNSEEPALGVVTLVRRRATAYDLAELGLLQQLCEHLALAVRADRAARRRTEVADALRAGLLPRGLPEPPGLRIAAAFAPADPQEGADGPAVGGDFYDAVPSGEGWAVMLGDVSGRDEEAAALTATVRHSLGALAHSERRPEEVLAKANAYLRARGGDRFATVLLARLVRRRGGWRVTLSGAGHPPALVLPADGPVTPVMTGGRPLGLFEDARTAASTVDLGPGDMLLLHSDGVSGARSPDGRPFGDDGLATAAAAARDGASRLVDAVRDAVVQHAGGRLRDDVALLAVRVAD